MSVKLPKIIPNYNIENLNDVIDTRDEQIDIVNAINSGYLIYPSEELILEKFKNQSDFEQKNKVILEVLRKRKSSRSRSLPDNEKLTPSFYFPHISYLNFSAVPVIEIGEIALCKNLRVLNLSNNHLKHIGMLSDCTNLIRLDLNCNQIVDLPDTNFWMSLLNLKVLFLHNNPIGKLDYLKNLSASPDLEILTIFDTPLSLRKNYRHHVVNAIVTLKALDNYVISDEEIIEEANYINKFKSLTPEFYFDPTIEDAENDSFEITRKRTNNLIKNVNDIIAHNSPVHILQKFTRGFIARNHYKFMIQSRNISKFNAQVTVNIDEETESEMRADSEMNNSEQASKIIKWWKKPEAHAIPPRNLAGSKLSEKSFQNEKSFFENSLQEFAEQKSTKSRSAKSKIIIDLNKLNKLQYQSYSKQTFRNNNSNNLSSQNFNYNSVDPKMVSFSRLFKLINDYQKDNSSNKNKDPVYNMQMGNLVKKFNKEFNLDEFIEKSETNFRLPMLVPDNSILKVKERYIVDLIKEKHDGSQAVKDMQYECHKRINEQRSEVPVISSEKGFTNDQRFFQKAFGNMSLGCLRAIDKAYDDRNLVDKKHTLKKKVDKLKEQNKYSLQRVEYYKEDKIKEVHSNKNQENELKSSMDVRFEEDYDKLKESVLEKRNKRGHLNNNRRRDVNLAVEFSKQHLSVSKALQKHEYLTFKELKAKENTELINKLKNNKEQQRELVNKYMQQRNVLRLIQANNDRAIINKRLQDDNGEDKRAAKIRVEYLRYLEYNRHARSSQKKPVKTENITNVCNVGDTLHTTSPDAHNTESHYFNEVK